MKKKIAWIFILVLVAIVLWIAISIVTFRFKAWENTSLNLIPENQISTLCCEWQSKTVCFDVELAKTAETRAKWLMYRDEMSDDSWMLFIFDNLWMYSFWMKNTLIPLEWIRLNQNMKIVDMIPMEPCKTEYCPSYTPNNEAMYVLEINQHLITKSNLLQIWNYCYLDD